MPDRDPALLEKLRRQHVEARPQRFAESAQVSQRFARGDFEERPWRRNDKLILRDTATRFDVRYLVGAPVAHSWDFSHLP
jgi:hypothetical protein